MEKPISKGEEPAATQNVKPFTGLLFYSKEEAEYILDAYGPGDTAMGYVGDNGEIEAIYRPHAAASYSEDDLYMRSDGEWGASDDPEFNPWANCPEGWENWGKDPDEDPDAWDMPDYWWGE